MEERYMYFQSKEKNRWMSIFILIAFLCTTFFTPGPAFAAATPEDAAARVEQLINQGMSRKDAIKQTAAELDLPKNVVYDAALHI